MKKIKWSEKVTNEEFVERTVEKRTLLNYILRRKVNWIGHHLRRNCLFHNAIKRTDDGSERSRKKKSSLMI